MTPAPVAAAAALTVAEKGPSWSSEIRKWLPTFIIGILVIVVIIGGLIWGVSALFNYFDGQCEDQGYESLVGCAFGQSPLGDITKSASSAALNLFLFTNPITAPFLIRRNIRRKVTSGLRERLKGRLTNPFKRF